jgi:tRNA pseudouridine38-40 synthase
MSRRDGGDRLPDDADGRLRAFRLAYDGRPFHGFQRQPTVPTVEDALFDALDRLGVFDREDRDRPAGYAAAGRTDAGVSATAQTVAIECPEWCTPRALNGELPADVRAWASAPAPDGFHATHDATRRMYVYHLYGPDLDDDRARAAAAILRGDHDFHNLTTDTAGTVRDLSVEIDRDGEFLRIRAAADGFPRHLVRRIASVVRGVGAGSRPLEWVCRLLGTDPLDGPEGVPTAAPEPLLLTDVSYPELTFERDPEASASAAAVFGERRRESRVRTRVAAHLASVAREPGSGPGGPQ